MDLGGRYVKVLEDFAKTHYPCIKGGYILFNHWGLNKIQHWGEMGKRSNYFGINVHLNPDFQLMPIGFSPEPQYEIY